MKQVGKLLGTATGFMALGVLLVSCGPPAGQVSPERESEQGPSREAQKERQEDEERLQTLSTEAEDLFNRGENDLACERVRQVQELQSELGVEPSEQRLEQAQACITD